ncbi:hypothetical protein ACP70R_006623 [Stipagrostis hirtigluma subsp. patula]
MNSTEQIAAADMDVILSLVSLLLVALAGGGSHPNLAAAVAMKPTEEYWQSVLPETPMPAAISDLLSQAEGYMAERGNLHLVQNYHLQRPNNDVSNTAKGPRNKIGINSQGTHTQSPKYVTESTHGLKKISVTYGAESTDDLKEVSGIYGSGSTENLIKFPVIHGLGSTEDLNKISVIYGSEITKDLKKFPILHGSLSTEDVKKISVSYGYGLGYNEDLKKISAAYGPGNTDDLKKISSIYGSPGTNDMEKLLVGSEHNEDKALYQDKKPHQVSEYVPKDEKGITITDSAASKGERHDHLHSQDYGNKRLAADIFFFHDVLRPGLVISPTIPLTTFVPPLLPRRLADSIPFSTEHLDDILTMFSPVSTAMAAEIQWTLGACEHPRPLPGDKAGCAASMEALTELPMALLGTRDVRAFSPNMPTDLPGASARRGRYNVTDVRKVSESPEMVTCHDLTYPYAVFYCHTAKPTVAYEVTLASMDEEALPVEALAVCHLDTSQWDPENPFFELHSLKPGEVAVCHFLSKLSVIWVPAGEQGGAHEAQ